jgi:hypothetical protein
VTLTSTSNQVAVDAGLGHKFKLNALVESTEFQVPTNAIDGDEYLITLEQDSVGGRIVTFASAYDPIGQLDPPIEPDSHCVISVVVRDFGSGLEYAYAVSHAQTLTGLVDVDETLTTVNDTVTTIAAFATTTDDASYLVEISAHGKDTTGQVDYERLFRAKYYRDNVSVVTQTPTNNIATENSNTPTWAVTATFAGSTLLIQVKGDATNATDWRVKGIVQEL